MDIEIAYNEGLAMRFFDEASVVPFSFHYDGRMMETRRLEGTYIDVTRWQREVILIGGVLEVRAPCTIYEDVAGFEWELQFANHGSERSGLLSGICAVDQTVGPVVAPALHRLTGSSCKRDDWLPHTLALSEEAVVQWGPTGGRSSDGACPFWTLTWMGPQGPEGVVTALGWSGSWRAEVKYGLGKLHLQAWWPNVALRLEPGEVIRGPRVLQVWFHGDLDHGHNLFRQAMLAHVLPRDRETDELVLPPIADLTTSSKIDNAPNEQFVYSHIRALEDSPIEVYWIDAYQHAGGFPHGMGNYDPDDVHAMTSQRRFPHTMKQVSAKVHEAGMDFLLWVEPERVAPDTILWREHPEWLLHADGKDYALLDLGNPAAWLYIYKFLCKVIEECELSWLRIDFNMDPLPYWQQADGPERSGIHEIRHVLGLYRLLDYLREKYPHLCIDNCASGGRRIDLEMCSRATPLWRSDLPGSLFVHNDYLEAAMLNQAATAGLTGYVPFSGAGGAATTPYLFWSNFCGGINLMEDRRLPDVPGGQIDEWVLRAQEVRKYLTGNFYLLTEVNIDPRSWCGYQWHRPDLDAGVIFLFRRHMSPYKEIQVQLRGIDPERQYRTRELHRDSWPIVGSSLSCSHWRIAETPGARAIEYIPNGQSDVPAT